MHLSKIRHTIPAKFVALACGLMLALPAAHGQGKAIKPGFNLFSKEQDIALGKEAAVEIEKEVQVVDDRELTAYIDRMGRELAKHSQDPDYEFTFKVVADPAINAFALPGGPIYINTGLIANADNEAQLAGVVGHEIGHVVLRHSTNQASKSAMFQLPAMLASGALNKQGGMLAALGSVGLGLGLNSALMRYSRKAETQSDTVGARMMAKAGYNPIEAANFFKKLEEAGGARGPEFLSSHPNPGNRSENIREEIASFPNRNYTTNSREFERMKERAKRIQPKAAATPPAETGNDTAAGGNDATEGAVTQVASGAKAYTGRGFVFEFASDWTAHQGNDGSTVTIVPSNGVVKGTDGKTSIARGILSGIFSNDESQQKATSALIADLTQSNPGLEPIRGYRKSMRIGGRQGETVFMEGPSPLSGQREYVWMVTSKDQDDLFYMLMIAPENEYEDRSGYFEQVVRSIRFQ